MACKATCQSRASPRDAQVARMRGKATRVHADARMAPRGMRGADTLRAHGLVGPSEIIGAVTQMCYAPLHFILVVSSLFFRVGLCYREFLNLQDTWQHYECGIRSFHIRRVDLVDSGPLDCPQKHMRKLELSIA